MSGPLLPIRKSAPKKSVPTAKKLADLADGIRVTSEEIDTVLADAAQSGKKLASHIRGATTAMRALRESGLTGEALVVLVTEKCATYTTAGGRTQRPTPEMVQCVLEALLRIGEYSAE